MLVGIKNVQFSHMTVFRYFAGEGSWCQLLRLGANSRTISIDIGLCAPHLSLSVVEKVELWAARELKAVWISHPHADHHLGLVSDSCIACC